MRGTDIYTLVFRVLGIYLIYDTIVVWVTQVIALLSSPRGFGDFGSAPAWVALWVALPAVVFILGAYIFIRFAPRFAAWLSGEEGEKTIGLNLGGREFLSLMLFGIGLYLAVTAAAGRPVWLPRPECPHTLWGPAPPRPGDRRSFWRFLQTTRRG